MATAHLGAGVGAVGTAGAVGMAGVHITATGTLGAVGTIPGGAVPGADIIRISTAGIRSPILAASTAAITPATSIAVAFHAASARYVRTMAQKVVLPETLELPAQEAPTVRALATKTVRAPHASLATRKLLPVSSTQTRRTVPYSKAHRQDPLDNPHNLLPRVPSEPLRVAEALAEAEIWAEAAAASAAVAAVAAASADADSCITRENLLVSYLKAPSRKNLLAQNVEPIAQRLALRINSL